MGRDRERQTHESFGMIRANRVSGHTALFGVDYPQQHFIRLEISGGYVEREYSEEWFYDDKVKFQRALSEVQWARLISSMNSRGTPCTITGYADGGKWHQVEDPPVHMGDNKKAKAEIATKARVAMESVAAAEAELEAMLQPGAKITKQAIAAARGRLSSALTDIKSNLPFLVQQVQETVERAANAAKSEVDAYVGYTLSELGKELLGEKMREGGIPLRLAPPGGFKELTDQSGE